MQTNTSFNFEQHGGGGGIKQNRKTGSFRLTPFIRSLLKYSVNDKSQNIQHLPNKKSQSTEPCHLFTGRRGLFLDIHNTAPSAPVLPAKSRGAVNQIHFL